MIDSALQRLNMVESQVRTSDVTDRRIIRAMLDVPRELFVPPALASIAYMDEAVPVGSRTNGAEARGLVPPRTLAKLIQLARIGEDAVVLDVGCATGYSTAVLAKIAARVVAVESDRELAETAARTLAALAVDNAKVVTAPLTSGAPGEGPYDAVIVNGAIPAIAPALLHQVRDGGRLVAVIGDGTLTRAHVTLRTKETYDTQPAFEAAAPRLPGFDKPRGFVF